MTREELYEHARKFLPAERASQGLTMEIVDPVVLAESASIMRYGVREAARRRAEAASQGL